MNLRPRYSLDCATKNSALHESCLFHHCSLLSCIACLLARLLVCLLDCQLASLRSLPLTLPLLLYKAEIL